MKKEKINIGELWKVQNYINDISKTLANELTQYAELSMVKAFDNIIDKFYEKHKPASYRRKRGFYSAIEDHKTHLINDKRYKAYITVSSNNMDDHYRISKNNVFDLIWNKGVRGLPYKGNSPLQQSYCFYSNHFEVGELWINPYWSGKDKPYDNVFQTTVDVDGFNSPRNAIPNLAMSDFVNDWGQLGKKECEKIVNKIS